MDTGYHITPKFKHVPQKEANINSDALLAKLSQLKASPYLTAKMPLPPALTYQSAKVRTVSLRAQLAANVRRVEAGGLLRGSVRVCVAYRPCLAGFRHSPPPSRAQIAPVQECRSGHAEPSVSRRGGRGRARLFEGASEVFGLSIGPGGQREPRQAQEAGAHERGRAARRRDRDVHTAETAAKRN